MPVIFLDSFNHYSTLVNKWDFVGNGSIVSAPTIARTGTRCMQVFGGSFGPTKNIGPQQTAVQYTKLIQGVALQIDALTNASHIMYFSCVVPFEQRLNIIVALNLDGSISVFRGPGDGGQTLLGTSAAGLFQFSPVPSTTGWNYIEVKWYGHVTDGTVEVRLMSPIAAMQTILTITGVKTVAASSAPYSNQVQILAAAGIVHACYFADYYCIDWTDTSLPASDYQGGVRIYHDVPFADGATDQWTPLAGANWQNVSEVPPDGDTSYNSASVAGLIDQYSHNVTGVPGNASILSVQHVMDLEVTAGARAITSVAGGVAHANSVYLGNGYAMQTYNYDRPPGLARSWAAADFPFEFGPEVTA